MAHVFSPPFSQSTGSFFNKAQFLTVSCPPGCPVVDPPRKLWGEKSLTWVRGCMKTTGTLVSTKNGWQMDVQNPRQSNTVGPRWEQVLVPKQYMAPGSVNLPVQINQSRTMTSEWESARNTLKQISKTKCCMEKPSFPQEHALPLMDFPST